MVAYAGHALLLMAVIYPCTRVDILLVYMGDNSVR